MGVNDRLFAPPLPDLEKVEARLALLPVRLRLLIQSVGESLAYGEVTAARNALMLAQAMAPAQPDVMRLAALLLAQVGRLRDAAANFESALRAAPDDSVSYFQYARFCEEAGDTGAALRLRQRAVECLPDSPLAWADLGEHLFKYRSVEMALEPLERATRLARDYAPAQLKFGSALVACGRIEEGAAAVRRALRSEPHFGAAWLELSDIKTVSLTPEEAERMRELLRGNELSGSERTAVEFALARACEDFGSYQEAFELLMDANRRRCTEMRPWPIEQFCAEAAEAERAFDSVQIVAEDPRLGEQVIFVVGMPRSGTTLVEQILASHEQVKGAGELDTLARVLTEESERRHKRYPEWAREAAAQDWTRLGQRYLSLTAQWRAQRPRFVDKMTSNWRLLGAMRAMLPGARIMICRRDPLENCWSCFKQYFQSGSEFSYDLDHLARFWKAFDRAASVWSRRSPEHVRQQEYEALTENPETEIHTLLNFCELPFDPACLRFQDLQRSVQTLSASQVRRPMQKWEPRAVKYGALLDPLRVALGIAPIGCAARKQEESEAAPRFIDVATPSRRGEAASLS